MPLPPGQWLLVSRHRQGPGGGDHAGIRGDQESRNADRTSHRPAVQRAGEGPSACAIPISRPSIRCAICAASPRRLSNAAARCSPNTAVTAVEEKDGAVTVRTANNASVQAANAVVATNSPINDRVALHTKLAPYRTYAMAITIARDSIEDALYWDTLDPYHYVRLESGRGDTQYLIVGGADHKTGEADDGWARFEGIESWIRGLLPQARQRHTSLVRASSRYGRLCSVHRPQSRQRARLRSHRRLRAGPHPWRGGQPRCCRA